MIIQSLLDTDLYKFTMMQVVLHHFPGAQVEYKFKCRTEGVDFRPYIDEIRDEVGYTVPGGPGDEMTELFSTIMTNRPD